MITDTFNTASTVSNGYDCAGSITASTMLGDLYDRVPEDSTGSWSAKDSKGVRSILPLRAVRFTTWDKRKVVMVGTIHGAVTLLESDCASGTVNYKATSSFNQSIGMHNAAEIDAADFISIIDGIIAGAVKTGIRDEAAVKILSQVEFL